ncbi:MAG: hypothetical protein AAGD01_10850 [Acidobacteriota bacterium]
MVNETRAALVEYGLSLPPLVMVFELNPKTLTRSRSVTVETGNLPGSRGGYGFLLPTETARASQGVTPQVESFDITVLLDATDRMDSGDPIASSLGVQPEIDTLRSMAEPKVQGPGGVQLLASLGGGEPRAFERDRHASVLLFLWGLQVLPVFLTSLRVQQQAHLPSLMPYRAEATLTLQVIESENPFYQVETLRQTALAAVNAASTIAGSLNLSFGVSF